MKKIAMLSLIMYLLTGCSMPKQATPESTYNYPASAQNQRETTVYRMDYNTIIRNAEKKATPQARQVLVQVRNMVEQGEIVRGSCWDYLHSAFNRAGYPQSKRSVIFKGNKRGPYANASILQPGDWLYHINHSYNNVEHSGMFIDWIDSRRKIALMLSYAGENRGTPARYKSYDLSSVYNVMRVK